jgi:uncharacterized coiled-coil DUF342 family protein
MNMTIDKAVSDKVKGGRSLFERITLYIPLYRGYRSKNLRRDVDREVRMAVSLMIKATKRELENVHRDVVDGGDMTLARKLERIRNKVDTYNTKVEKAANGYSGVWASVKKLEKELDAVVEFDAKILESAGELRKDAENLRNGIGQDITKIDDFERKVDAQIEVYGQRELVLKGLAEEG